MSNIVFKDGTPKRFKLSELKGKNVEIASVGKAYFGTAMYLRDIETEDIYAIELSEKSIEVSYKDCLLKNFRDVDFSEIKAAMIVIYDHPKDYPKSYVARVWDMNKPTNIAVANKSLDILRNAIPEYMSCIKRHRDDDPCIVEVWL